MTTVRLTGFTAEEMTAKRRVEREKFKIDRAEAILKAQAEAEANFEAGILPTLSSSVSGSATPSVVISAAPPSGATITPSLSTTEDGDPEVRTPSLDHPTEPGTSSAHNTPHEAKSGEPSQPQQSLEDLVDMEHLQLTLSEAFFCSWALGCLKILDPATVSRH